MRWRNSRERNPFWTVAITRDIVVLRGVIYFRTNRRPIKSWWLGREILSGKHLPPAIANRMKIIRSFHFFFQYYVYLQKNHNNRTYKERFYLYSWSRVNSKCCEARNKYIFFFGRLLNILSVKLLFWQLIVGLPTLWHTDLKFSK